MTRVARWKMPLLVSSWWIVAAPCGLAQQTASDSAQLLAVAANSYRANLEALEYVTCRYTITWGFAKSLDDALAGQLEPGSHQATCVFFKDGRTLRFRLEEDAATKATLDKPPKPEKSAISPGMMTGPIVPFMTTDCLLNGTHGLLFDPRGHSANIYDNESPKGKHVDPNFLLTLLQVNTHYDFGLLADQAARGEIRFSLEEPKADGRLKTSFRFPEDPLFAFTVDLTRGSLPTRIELISETGLKSVSTTVVPQIRTCSKGRWFPERIVTFLKQTPTQSPCLVKDFKVTELDVDHRPPKDSFSIDLPAGTVISQFGEPQNYFKTRRVERTGPDDLGQIQQLTEKVPQVPQTDTAIVVPRSYTWVWYAIAGGIGLLGLLFVLRRYRVRRLAT